MPENLKTNCRRPVFLEELQAARNGSNISLHFNKIPNCLRQILQTYLEICIFCVLQKIFLQKQSAKINLKVPEKYCDEIWWRCDEIHIYYSKFESEIWRWIGNILLGLSFFIWFVNFLQMLRLYSAANKKSVI